MSGVNVCGNENGFYQVDGIYYIGSGCFVGYVLFNFDVDWQFMFRLKLFVQVSNLFDCKYVIGVQLGGNLFNVVGNYVVCLLLCFVGVDEFLVISGIFFVLGVLCVFLVGVCYSFD